ncbi:hypothetical protein CSA56_18940 [candidate division KSB3 bacterium]|uniref:Uncharacterized protein n=1 Tax=candidate division KSB3 bacterium TaxID=2044937 RepID=A0A2G6K6C3_9BACT|nr:MAG: hypothetical protein CSA56_18940 [candidate division KSB3 bacterium]
MSNKMLVLTDPALRNFDIIARRKWVRLHITAHDAGPYVQHPVDEGMRKKKSGSSERQCRKGMATPRVPRVPALRMAGCVLTGAGTGNRGDCANGGARRGLVPRPGWRGCFSTSTVPGFAAHERLRTDRCSVGTSERYCETTTTLEEA